MFLMGSGDRNMETKLGHCSRLVLLVCSAGPRNAAEAQHDEGPCSTIVLGLH